MITSRLKSKKAQALPGLRKDALQDIIDAGSVSIAYLSGRYMLKAAY